MTLFSVRTVDVGWWDLGDNCSPANNGRIGVNTTDGVATWVSELRGALDRFFGGVEVGKVVI